jgi:hypothetical protein
VSTATTPYVSLTASQDRGISKRWTLRWAPWARLESRKTGVPEDAYRALHRERMLQCLRARQTTSRHDIDVLELDDPFASPVEHAARMEDARLNRRVRRKGGTPCQQAAKK